MSEQDKSKTIKATATPEWLAEMAVRKSHDGATILKWPNGRTLGVVAPLEQTDEKCDVDTVRRWLVLQTVGAYAVAKGACVDDLAAALDAATPVAWESLVQEAKRLKDNDANLVAEVARLREGITRVTLERDNLADRSAAKGSDVPEQGFDVSQAMALARVGDMLGLDREHNDDDEALVRAEIARLLKVAADAEKKVAPDEVAKARAEGEKAGRQSIISAFIVEHNRHVEAAEVENRRAGNLRKEASEADAEVQTHRRTAELYATVIKTIRQITGEE